MSKKIFDLSVFSSIFSGNDYFIENWTMNVYNKIKKSNLLPFYINRDKSMDESSVLNSSTSTYSDNSLFTLGNTLVLSGNGTLTIGNQLNLSKSFEINFEVGVVSATGVISVGDFFSIYTDTVVKATFLTDEVTLTGSDIYFIKITRSHTVWKLYVNRVLVSTVTSSTDNETTLAKCIDYTSTDLDLVSNYKILSLDNSKIIHWWRLNCDFEDSFIDVGLNDYDFYSFFYTIIKMSSLPVRFSHFFRLDTDNSTFMKKFLDSKGVIYTKDSSNEELLYLVLNWKDSLNERATTEILKKKDIVTNYSLVASETADLSAVLVSGVTIGENYKIEFLVDLTDPDLYYRLINDTIHITRTGDDFTFNFDLVDSFGEVHLESTFTETNMLCEFTLVKNGSNVSLYRNSVLSTSTFSVSPLNPTLILTELFQGFVFGHAIDYLLVTALDIESDFYDEKSLEIKYNFDYVDSVFIPDVTRTTAYEARLVGVDSLPDNMVSILYKEDLFDINDNYKFKEIDGEFLRTYEKHSDSELVFAKTGFYDLSWVLEKLSPLNYQTYPITMFNKLENKSATIQSLIDYPLRSMRSSLDIGVGDCYIENGKIRVDYIDSEYRDLFLSETDLSGTSYKKEWIVPCMGERSYEVSFRMEVLTENPDFNMKFGLVGDGLKNAKINVDYNLFINDYTIDKSGFYWFRGVIYSKSEDLADKELGLSVDYNNTNHLKFKSDVVNTSLSIKLSLMNNAVTSPEIYIHDIQFRLLSLPMTKVVLGTKNTAFSYGRNNSLYSEDELLSITKEMIPYNMNLKQI